MLIGAPIGIILWCSVVLYAFSSGPGTTVTSYPKLVLSFAVMGTLFGAIGYVIERLF